MMRITSIVDLILLTWCLHSKFIYRMIKNIINIFQNIRRILTIILILYKSRINHLKTQHFTTSNCRLYFWNFKVHFLLFMWYHSLIFICIFLCYLIYQFSKFFNTIDRSIRTWDNRKYKYISAFLIIKK